MSICHGCGGVVGRDCYNPAECEMIARDMQRQHDEKNALTADELATLAGLRAGTLVAVPSEPTPDFWPSYCAANGAMPGSAWDTLSQKLYRAIIKNQIAAAVEAAAREGRDE